MSWKPFPKVELHLHLEGAADPAFVRGLAAEKSIDIRSIFDGNGAYKYNGFREFLAVYEAATLAIKNPEDFKRLTQSVLENLAEHNVVYAETFVSPDFCGGRDLGAWSEYLAAMQEAHVDGVTLKGIVTCIRHLAPIRHEKQLVVLPKLLVIGWLVLEWLVRKMQVLPAIFLMRLIWLGTRGYD